MRKRVNGFCLILATLLLPLFLQAQGTVSLMGIVSDAFTGFPIDGAEVLVTPADSSNNTTYRGTTDNSGFFAFVPIDPGIYLVEISATDFQTEVVGPIQVYNAVRINVAMNPDQPPLGQGSISGTVYDTATRLPIAGVRVSAGGGPANQVITFSDSSGAYSLDSLQYGIYNLMAEAPGYLPYINNAPIMIEPGNENVQVDVPLSPDPNIGADVEVFGTVSDSLGNPVGFAIIIFEGVDSLGNPVRFTTNSSPAGAYRLSVRPGVYDVLAGAQGFVQLVVRDFQAFSGPLELNLVLNRANNTNFAFLNGIVEDSLTGLPVEGVLLTLHGQAPNGDPVFLQTPSMPDGTYDFMGAIPPGVYQLSAEMGAYLPFNTRINLQAGQNTYPIFLISSSGSNQAVVSGVIVDSLFGRAVFPATITLSAANPAGGDSLTVENRPDGGFTAGPVTPGLYLIRVSARGYETKTLRANLIEGPNRLIVEMLLSNPPALGVISGRVTLDGSGDPVALNSAFIEVMSPNGVGTYSAPVDSGGNYRVTVAAGSYLVAVHYLDVANPGGFPYFEYFDDAQDIRNATIVSVSENGTTSGIDFGVPDGGGVFQFTVTGNVSDDAGNPLEAALVLVRAASNNPIGDSLVFPVYTDNLGNYTLQVPFIGVHISSVIVSAERRGYDIEFWQEQPSIDLADELFVSGDTVFSGIDFTLSPYGSNNTNSISGTVTDTDNLPINQAFVVGSNMRTGRITFAFTDPLGHYSLAGLENDPFVVLFAAASHVPEYYDDALIWEDAQFIPVNGDLTGIDAQLAGVTAVPGEGIITGTITDRTGLALSGVVVSVVNGNGELVGYDFSSPTGTYQIAGLPSGSHTVRVTKINYVSETEVVTHNGGNAIHLQDFDLDNALVGIGPEELVAVPATLSLSQNYPNPFNPSTTISFALPENSAVKLTVYNALGQVVTTLADGQYPAGVHNLKWNGRNANGLTVATGIYLYRLEVNGQSMVRKMLFAK